MKSGETKKGSAQWKPMMDTPQSDLFARNCVLNNLIIVFFVEIVKLIKIKGEKIVQ